MIPNQQQNSDNHRRRSRFETYEERLALSAQPLSELASVPSIGLPQEMGYGEIAPAVLPVNDEIATAQLDLSLTQHVLTSAQVHDLDLGLTQHVLTSAQMSDADRLTGLDQVRAQYGLTGAGQTVAIIDSGIAYDHVALGGGFGSGYRVVGGWDFAENDANPYDDAPSGFHGTHVAGIVGSSDARYQGVASGVDLVALRVFDDRGNGSFKWAEQALQWVHLHRNDFENPITTVNLSLGAAWNSSAPPNWATLEDEFAQLKADGIFVSVSAGNSFTSYNAPGLAYPAASPYVVPVASVDANGKVSNFSQRDSRVIAAPGRSIISTVPDYALGADGIKNDFAAASGTSMAAPYVAGAAALVREAMQFVGINQITQDTIYNQLRGTADSVFDAVTNASYLRLNVQRAIESLMPTDDFGSSASTAHSLGTLAGNSTFAGTIGKLTDQDYFSFTAGGSGRVSFTFDVTHGMKLQAELVGGNASFDKNVLSFDVQAGQTYTFALSGTEQIGNYQAQAKLETTATVLGTVDLRQLADQRVAGDMWFQVTAARSGTFSVESLFTHSAGNIDLQVLNGQKQLLAASQSATNSERVDLSVTAGQTLFVRLVGANQDVDVTFANLVSVQGSTVNVFGTTGADKFTLQGGSQVALGVNGLQYQFNANTASAFSFQGGDGDDTLVVSGSTANLNLQLNDVRLVGSTGNAGSSNNSGNSNSDSGSSNGGSQNSGGSNASDQSGGAVDAVAQRAYDLDQQYGFKSSGNYHSNWARQGEKWIQDQQGSWFFLLKDGRLFKWNGSPLILTSNQVATLDASFHADPSKLHDAKLPARTGDSSGGDSSGGDSSGGSSSGGSSSGGSSSAESGSGADKGSSDSSANKGGGSASGGGSSASDNNNGGSSAGSGGGSSGSGNTGSGHTGSGESSSGNTGSGDTGSGNTGGGSSADSGNNLADRAADLDRQLGLKFGGSYHLNWVGLNEKWMQDGAGKWYFMTPDGGLYQWNGSRVLAARSGKVAQFDSTFYANPKLLHDASNVAGQALASQGLAGESDSAKVVPAANRSTSSHHSTASDGGSTQGYAIQPLTYADFSVRFLATAQSTTPTSPAASQEVRDRAFLANSDVESPATESDRARVREAVFATVRTTAPLGVADSVQLLRELTSPAADERQDEEFAAVDRWFEAIQQATESSFLLSS